ncbi:hypothetical protein S245_037453, partial [Arachis hypogaea]
MVHKRESLSPKELGTRSLTQGSNRPLSPAATSSSPARLDSRMSSLLASSSCQQCLVVVISSDLWWLSSSVCGGHLLCCVVFVSNKLSVFFVFPSIACLSLCTIKKTNLTSDIIIRSKSSPVTYVLWQFLMYLAIIVDYYGYF